MKIKYNFLYFLVLSILWLNPTISQDKVRTSDKPKWVDQIRFSQGEGEEEETSPFQYLLVDMQENAILKQMYFHYAIKLNNSNGVQEMSTISVDYDPSYQFITFHKIYIHREDQLIERTTNNFQFLQRETDMNRALYDGAISLVKELEDIRQGDIIEYSFTINGYNPIYGTHRFATFQQDYGVYINKLYQTYLIDKNVNIKYSLDAVKAQINQHNKTWKYKWELNNLKPVYEDYTVPSWYDQRKMVSISTMKQWDEIVDWGKDLYSMSFSEKKKFRSSIENMFSLSGNEVDILNAIRFVQDEIRYLGFENGIQAFKPHRPQVVLERRFGDCKDKSFLLASILTEMGVDAAPMYVHSSKGKSLNEKLTSPNQFDHCIVTFNVENEQYFVDPTISNQGGNLENFCFPNYGLGIPIKENSDGLIKVENNNIPIIIVDELIDLDSIGGGATYNITSKYSGTESDRMRSYFSRNSRSDIKKHYEDFYKNVYPNTNITSLEIIDSTRDSKNEIIINESYSIKDIWKTNDNYLNLNIYSPVIENYLNLEPHQKDLLPYDLGEPKEYIQTIRVKLPEQWKINNEEQTTSNNNFDYSLSISYANDELQIKNRYYLKNDVIEANDIDNVTSDINKILDDINYELSYNKELLNNGNDRIAWQIILICLLGISLGLIFINWINKKFDPIPVQTNLPMTIGGWLILPTIGLIISPFIMIKDLVQFNSERLYNQSTWKFLWTEEQVDIMTILSITGIVNVFSLIISIYLIVLLLKRRSNLPILLISYYVFTFLILLFDSIVGHIYDPLENIWNEDVLKSLVTSLIWIPYFLFSERVQNTFVFQKNTSINVVKNEQKMIP